MGSRGEYEPRDSRNVTGTASTRDGRWTNREGIPPLANGEQPLPPPDKETDGDDEPVEFEPAPELVELMRKRRDN